jgi:hypothetical protein
VSDELKAEWFKKGHDAGSEGLQRVTAERDRYREALRQVGYRAEHMRIDPKATLAAIEKELK